MPRTPRIEYAGAVYHVLCRGDRRERIVRGEEDAELFLQTLGETCARTGWVVHAYVVMPNHYHLLVATPEANLVAGMRWLQSTYTLRFNARHRECGHLFQGRYKALMVEEEDPAYFRLLSDYIHLNPARAHLLPPEQPELDAYPWSSYKACIGRAESPAWLQVERVFHSHGWEANRAGRREYAVYLRRRMTEGLNDRAAQQEWRAIRRGWCLGAAGFRAHMLELLSGVITQKQHQSFAGEGLRAHDAQAAATVLARALAALQLSAEDLQRARPSAAAKQGVVWLLRSFTTVDCRWIMEQVRMGHPSNISRAVQAFEPPATAERRQLKRILLKCKD